MSAMPLVAALSALTALGAVTRPETIQSKAATPAIQGTPASPSISSAPSSSTSTERHPFDGIFATTGKAGPRFEFSLSRPWGKPDGPKVICGTVVFLDPKVDAKMGVPIPGDAVHYAMRLYRPVLCRD